MNKNEERICQHCGTTNYGVIHHCLKCGAELPGFSNRAETLVDFGEQITPTPHFDPAPPTPPDYLEVISELDRGYTYNLTDGISFGRSGSCDIVIESPKASRHHAKIVHTKDQRWMLIDMESTNGTLLNDEKISEPTEVVDGDQIQVGNFSFRAVINKPIVSQKPPIAPPLESKEIESEPLDSPPQRKGCRSKKGLIIAAGALILICICSILYFGWDLLSQITIQ
ncbi:MAG: FHA domain-containing protein [Chloroflexota bacterium]